LAGGAEIGEEGFVLFMKDCNEIEKGGYETMKYSRNKGI
jgi:hypothetical protein